jgi:hypothetical protein
MMNIKSISCKLLLVYAILAPVLITVKAEDPRIVITYPLSGMHTRAKTVLLEGKTIGFSPNNVTIILDESTVLTKTIQCIDNRFQLEINLGSGRTTISAQAKLDGKQTVEAGFYFFRDCSVTNIIGSYEVYVNSDKHELDKPFVMEKNRTLVPLRQVADFFGANVSWDSKKNMATVTLGRKKSTIVLGLKTANVAGFSVDSNPPAKIIGNTLYVSSRLLSKTVGGGVAWDSYTRTLTLAVP